MADLEGSIGFLRDTLGLPLVRSQDVEGRPDRSRFFRCGETDIELIDVLDPVQRAIRLGTGGATRIEHVAFEVDDLVDAIRHLEAAGVTVSPVLELGNASNVWTDPATSAGVMYQLVEARRGHRSQGGAGLAYDLLAAVPTRRRTPP